MVMDRLDTVFRAASWPEQYTITTRHHRHPDDQHRGCAAGVFIGRMELMVVALSACKTAPDLKRTHSAAN